MLSRELIGPAEERQADKHTQRLTKMKKINTYVFIDVNYVCSNMCVLCMQMCVQVSVPVYVLKPL